ncbi:MAG: nucleoside hydrolase [Clostridia bacterium]|nr:nucleoside hydrolase [Clostridia bacterium]
MDMNELLKKIKDGSVKNVILDTDTYNEVDDQFTIAYLLRAEDKVKLLSITAAPFLNERSSSPEDGMLKSYDEILHTLEMADKKNSVPVYRGATGYMTEKNVPQISDAASNIVRIVNESEETVYIVAIGCITNVASAIVLDPSIADKAVVIWLGGHAYWHPNTNEFNMKQDIAAANTVFDSGIAVIHVPCFGMCSELVTTLPELEYYLRGKNKLCDWLTDMVVDYAPKQSYAWSKIMWDVAAAAVLVKPDAFMYDIRPTPSVTNDFQYSFDQSRHKYIYISRLNRNMIFGDMFKRLS